MHLPSLGYGIGHCFRFVRVVIFNGCPSQKINPPEIIDIFLQTLHALLNFQFAGWFTIKLPKLLSISLAKISRILVFARDRG